MPELPGGNLTFFFTDIEGSTKLWEKYPEVMEVALPHHDYLLRTTIEANQGFVFKTVGDAFCAVFHNPYNAVLTALAAQRALFNAKWDAKIGMLRVRMALHTGLAHQREGDYFGQPVNRVARILSTGHGGQVLLSQAVQQSVKDNLPQDVSLRELGEHYLKDLSYPEHIYQLVAADLPSNFPPLRTADVSSLHVPENPYASRLRLRFVEGPRRGEVVEVPKPFQGGPALRVGRVPGCDIQIDSNDVSRRHCEIFVEVSGELMLCDMGSVNGTLINGQPLIPKIGKILQPGMKIQVGRSILIFEGLIEQLPEKEISDETVMTIATNLFNYDLPPTPVPGTAQLYSLVTIKDGRQFPIRNTNALIGRSFDSDIMLDSPLVSYHHAKLTNTTDGMQLNDLSNNNQTYINGTALIAPTLLRDGDKLRFGDVEAIFRVGQ